VFPSEPICGIRFYLSLHVERESGVPTSVSVNDWFGYIGADHGGASGGDGGDGKWV
jgi:hypothetical protein